MVAQLYLQALGSLFVSGSQGCGGDIPTRLYAEVKVRISSKSIYIKM
jgi:hypothetical protein